MDLVINGRPFESDSENAVGAIPDDAMRPGGRYEVQGFLLNTTGKTYLRVYISHIYDPDRLYFQLMENQYSLNTMMDRLQSFYPSDKSRFYRISSEDLIIGLPVAAIYETSDGPIWHRGFITDVSTDRNSAEVFYVDYGSKVFQPLKNLRMMRRKFMAILAQAVRAKLANVKKPDGLKEWPKETTNAMISFSEDYPLICEVVGCEQNCFVVNVCDTHLPNRDIYLHHLLVNFGLAQYSATLAAPFSLDDLDNRCNLNIS
uniref:Tudor domain-containing protein n=1 Tax=Romanomermis culicivorax TaxID=13658 RepID=A0A915IVD3_ROMCU